MSTTEVLTKSIANAAQNGTGTLLRMYKTMVRIRAFEERVAALVEAGEVKTPCHLYIGQEAVAAGVCENLRSEDTIWGGHRSHGHYLAKGGDPSTAMAEILGRATGCSGGRGGSMHLVAPTKGILGTAPIVAATIPLCVGAALAAKLQHKDTVAVAFFGDGALEEGHVYEAMNFAALEKLPVIFVCENNLYASHMHLSQRRVKGRLREAGAFQGLRGETVDGNDVVAVRDRSSAAIARARTGKGPSFMECLTFRWRGHVGPSWDMDVGVKRRGELKEWITRDPIAKARRLLEERGVSFESFAVIDREGLGEMEAAVSFARNSPYPDPKGFMEHVFAGSTEVTPHAGD